MDNPVTVIIGIIGAVLGGIFTFFGMKSSAATSSVPGIIQSLSNRVTAQEKRIDDLEKRIEGMKEEIDEWQGNYFQLLKWLKAFFKKHGIQEVIPEFHKEDTKQ